MKYYFIFLIALLSYQGQAQYKIRVKIENYQNDTCVLGHHYGDKTYVDQRVYERNDQGEFVFEGEESLEGGMYLILIKPQNVYFQFLISDEKEQQDIYLETKIDDNPLEDLNANLVIKNSPDNQAFLDYKSFLGELRKKANKWRNNLNEAKKAGKTKDVEKWTEKLQALDKEVQDYTSKLIEEHPDYLTSQIIKVNQQIDIPEAIKDNPERVNHYYRQHFWDNTNWKDDRLVRTTIFQSRLNTFIDQLTYQLPDSIIKSCDAVLQKTLDAGEAGEEYFRFAAIQLLNKYANTKIICMDAVYVHLAENYYCNGLAHWVDSAQLANICDDAKRLKPLRCKEVAPEIILQNVLDKNAVQLSQIKAKFTAVYFWDPTCNNCSKNSKALVPVYNKYKDKGFEIYGVCSKSLKEIDQCKKKIKELEMPWLNTTGESYPLAVTKKRYDIQYNPFMYLLDENKRIIWKRITPDQLDKILEREFKKMEEEKK